MAGTQDERELLYFNGINGDSGEYDLPPLTGEELYEVLKGESKADNLDELRFRHRQKEISHLGVKEGVDATKLEEAGWGIIFATDADPAIKDALSELIDLRRGQTEYFQIFEGGEKGFRRHSDSKGDWLARQGAGPGPADPEKVPYYLLIVGSPEEIPYRFQTQLDVQYAAGRLHFDTLQEYANYAASVVASETGKVKLSRDVTFFNVANEDDRATQRSAKLLIPQLSDELAEAVIPQSNGEIATAGDSWNFNTIVPEDADKAQLSRLLGGDQTPALLFSASHGMGFKLNSKRQLAHQGALLCRDWPGPEAWAGPIPQDHYFAGDDLDSNGNLLGQIAFLFACYGAGTPLNDEFSKQAFRDRKQIAPYPFMAQLPAKMVGHPRGGALAVIGHVERAWSNSYTWPKAGVQIEVFRSTLLRLLKGHPVGSAVEYFNDRYAEMSTMLSDELEEVDHGKTADPYNLSRLWTANNDARGYAIIGDPAVRMQVAGPNENGQEREQISVRKLNGQIGRSTVAERDLLPDEPETAEEAATSMAISDDDEASGETSEEAAPIASIQGQVGSHPRVVHVRTIAPADSSDPDGQKLAIQTILSLDGRSETEITDATNPAAGNLITLHEAMVKETVAARIAFLELSA